MATKFTYTETETQEIVQKYQSGVELDVLATDYAKSVASVRMKLVKLGVYKKAETSARPRSVTKTTTKSITKSENSALFFKCLGAVGPAPL